MQSFNISAENNKTVFSVLIGLSVSAICILLSSAAFAFIMTLLSLQAEYSSVFSTLSFIIGCFFGGLYIGTKLKKNGLLLGGSLGILIYIISTLIGIIASGFSFSAMSLFRVTACVFSGAVGGIVAVNRLSSKKYASGKYKY